MLMSLHIFLFFSNAEDKFYKRYEKEHNNVSTNELCAYMYLTHLEFMSTYICIYKNIYHE